MVENKTLQINIIFKKYLEKKKNISSFQSNLFILENIF